MESKQCYKCEAGGVKVSGMGMQSLCILLLASSMG